MQQLGFRKEWQMGEVPDDWSSQLYRAIHRREVKEWRDRMRAKVTLLRYHRIKLRLKQEPYLLLSRALAKRHMRLRAVSETLQVERGRQMGQRRSERRCLICKSGKVEDVYHFVGVCKPLAGKHLQNSASAIGSTVDGVNIRQRADWLLGTEPLPDAYNGVICRR